MGKARPIMTATPGNERQGRPPSSNEIRMSIRRDAKRLLGPLFEKLEQQRGLPVHIRRMT